MKSAESPQSETMRVTEALRNEIIEGHRRPGSRLVERNLATELGVSRVPIREALKKLASEGLVTNRPNTWSTVREFSPSDIADLNEVRTVFDVLSFELAAQRHTREGLARLEATMLKGRELADAGDVAGAHRCAAEFQLLRRTTRVFYEAMMKGPVQCPSSVRRTGRREPRRFRRLDRGVGAATSIRSARVGSAARSGLSP